MFQEEAGWYSMLFIAAHEDYLNINKVLDTSAAEFLTFINFYIRKTELDIKRIKASSKTKH